MAYQNSQEKLHQINVELNQINEKLQKNVKPEKPYTPIEPFLPKAQKPAFFGYNFFFQIIWLLFFPVYIIKSIITESFYIWNTLIFAVVVALIIMSKLYLDSLEDYGKEKRKNQNWFEARKREKARYEIELKNFREQLTLYEKVAKDNQLLKDRKEELQKLRISIRPLGETNIFKNSNFQKVRNNYSPVEPANLVQLKKTIYSISLLPTAKKQKFIDLLREVQKIQNSNLSSSEKGSRIKNELWEKQSPSAKLWIGAILGTLTGLAVFGTGGIGIVGLGGAVGVWGFLAGTGGGLLISSIIQNFEKKDRH